MHLIAIVDFHIAAHRVDRARELFGPLLDQTRAFPGAERIDWLVDRDDPCAWTLYERWRSADDEQAYRNWRAADGAVPELAQVLDARPGLRRFDAAE
ncbi:antibiotic biosynthesis monooxygenase [Microbacterium sp. HD4P20]|uniref:putative quinol monooxygenase n=1 Tax=Microbacterium sp. HD4P20 TaxID=2864874 RepID=UPI001C63F234|nr:antibiotic biosynthesis monooxygenase [Microbacterium sp. HD4P20]MCP2636335.1 antibiotic biosynthesis monooxygenase [Microbacterium sp. HD4P20]